MVQPMVCGHLRQPSGAPQTFPMAFRCAVFGLWGCPPGKPSVAEGLARKHRDMPGFATSVLNLLAFSFYFWAGGAALQRWVSVQQVPCSFYHFSSRGPALAGLPAALRQEGVSGHPITSHHVRGCCSAAARGAELIPSSSERSHRGQALASAVAYESSGFLARDRHPSPGSASTQRAVVADTESSSFARGTGARGKVLC